jgi:hypothetical protein
MLKINTYLSILLISALSSSAPSYAGEKEMWKQFRAQQGQKELDSQFEEPRAEPEVRVETRVVEKIVVKEVMVPVPTPVAVEKSEPTPQNQPEPVAPVADNSVTVEADGYIFKLKACQLAHRNIKCELNILSNENDGNLTLYSTHGSHSSKLFDRSGNEYHPSKVAMGNKNHKQVIKNKYVAGVIAKGSMNFENVNESTKSIALIELSLYNNDNRKYNRIKFRNVNLSL